MYAACVAQLRLIHRVEQLSCLPKDLPFMAYSWRLQLGVCCKLLIEAGGTTPIKHVADAERCGESPTTDGFAFTWEKNDHSAGNRWCGSKGKKM